MPSSPLVEVRAHLQRFLLGVESLPDFQLWFVGWRRRNEASIDALGHDIGLRLAEYTRGHWSEAQLRGKLLSLIGGGTLSSTVVSSAAPWCGSERYSAMTGDPQTKAAPQTQSS
jgi:hypothetical protein